MAASLSPAYMFPFFLPWLVVFPQVQAHIPSSVTSVSCGMCRSSLACMFEHANGLAGCTRFGSSLLLFVGHKCCSHHALW